MSLQPEQLDPSPSENATNSSASLDPSEAQLLGTVLSIQANFYWVKLDRAFLPAEAGGTSLLLCTRRSRLKKVGQQVMVGDRVQIEEPDWLGQRGAIAQVLPRHSQLDRPAIANVDQVLLVFALAKPPLDPFQLSRFLVTAESTGLAICLVLNKSDLVSLEAQQEWETRLHSWGYQPYFVSVRADRGLTALQQQLSNQITVVSGPSGVGKSSLINRLIPQAKLRTNAVSGKLARGRHTTRHVELFELPLGGLLADTPGFNQPELNCSPSELAHFFPEARQRLEENRCQFNNCLHREEPNCVVRGDWERYNQYLTFLSETIARQQALEQMGDAESTTKMKFKGDGQFITEPKLASKKYRRPSRRTEKQALRDLCRDVEEFTED